jgi:hypothetical protein
MSTFASFSATDLLRGTIVEPSWYRVKIESIGEKPSKDGGSINYPVEGIIQFNSESGDTAFAGVPLVWNFNSKAMGFAIGFLEALGIEVQPDTRYDLAKAAGEEIDVFVENGEYQGRLVNRVNHRYRTKR